MTVDGKTYYTLKKEDLEREGTHCVYRDHTIIARVTRNKKKTIEIVISTDAPVLLASQIRGFSICTIKTKGTFSIARSINCKNVRINSTVGSIHIYRNIVAKNLLLQGNSKTNEGHFFFHNNLDSSKVNNAMETGALLIKDTTLFLRRDKEDARTLLLTNKLYISSGATLKHQPNAKIEANIVEQTSEKNSIGKIPYTITTDHLSTYGKQILYDGEVEIALINNEKGVLNITLFTKKPITIDTEIRGFDRFKLSTSGHVSFLKDIKCQHVNLIVAKRLDIRASIDCNTLELDDNPSKTLPIRSLSNKQAASIVLHDHSSNTIKAKHIILNKHVNFTLRGKEGSRRQMLEVKRDLSIKKTTSFNTINSNSDIANIINTGLISLTDSSLLSDKIVQNGELELLDTICNIRNSFRQKEKKATTRVEGSTLLSCSYFIDSGTLSATCSAQDPSAIKGNNLYLKKATLDIKQGTLIELSNNIHTHPESFLNIDESTLMASDIYIEGHCQIEKADVHAHRSIRCNSNDLKAQHTGFVTNEGSVIFDGEYHLNSCDMVASTCHISGTAKTASGLIVRAKEAHFNTNSAFASANITAHKLYLSSKDPESELLFTKNSFLNTDSITQNNKVRLYNSTLRDYPKQKNSMPQQKVHCHLINGQLSFQQSTIRTHAAIANHAGAKLLFDSSLGNFGLMTSHGELGIEKSYITCTKVLVNDSKCTLSGTLPLDSVVANVLHKERRKATHPYPSLQTETLFISDSRTQTPEADEPHYNIMANEQAIICVTSQVSIGSYKILVDETTQQTPGRIIIDNAQMVTTDLSIAQKSQLSLESGSHVEASNSLIYGDCIVDASDFDTKNQMKVSGTLTAKNNSVVRVNEELQIRKNGTLKQESQSQVNAGWMNVYGTVDANQSYIRVAKSDGERNKPTYWYSDDDIRILLTHYLKEDNFNGVCLHGMLANNSNILKTNIEQFHQQDVGELTPELLIPINLNNNHWTLLQITYQHGESPTIAYFDPLGNPISNELKQTLKSIGKFADSDIQEIGDRVQDNGCDCGPWVVETARLLANNQAAPDSTYDITSNRKKHINILDLNEDSKRDQPLVNKLGKIKFRFGSKITLRGSRVVGKSLQHDGELHLEQAHISKNKTVPSYIDLENDLLFRAGSKVSGDSLNANSKSIKIEPCTTINLSDLLAVIGDRFSNDGTITCKKLFLGINDVSENNGYIECQDADCHGILFVNSVANSITVHNMFSFSGLVFFNAGIIYRGSESITCIFATQGTGLKLPMALFNPKKILSREVAVDLARTAVAELFPEYKSSIMLMTKVLPLLYQQYLKTRSKLFTMHHYKHFIMRDKQVPKISSVQRAIYIYEYKNNEIKALIVRGSQTRETVDADGLPGIENVEFPDNTSKAPFAMTELPSELEKGLLSRMTHHREMTAQQTIATQIYDCVIDNIELLSDHVKTLKRYEQIDLLLETKTITEAAIGHYRTAKGAWDEHVWSDDENERRGLGHVFRRNSTLENETEKEINTEKILPKDESTETKIEIQESFRSFLTDNMGKFKRAVAYDFTHLYQNYDVSFSNCFELPELLRENRAQFLETIHSLVKPGYLKQFISRTQTTDWDVIAKAAITPMLPLHQVDSVIYFSGLSLDLSPQSIKNSYLSLSMEEHYSFSNTIDTWYLVNAGTDLTLLQTIRAHEIYNYGRLDGPGRFELTASYCHNADDAQINAGLTKANIKHFNNEGKFTEGSKRGVSSLMIDHWSEKKTADSKINNTFAKGKTFDVEGKIKATDVTAHYEEYVHIRDNATATTSNVTIVTPKFNLDAKADLDYQNQLTVNGDDITIDGTITAPISDEAIAELEQQKSEREKLIKEGKPEEECTLPSLNESEQNEVPASSTEPNNKKVSQPSGKKHILSLNANRENAQHNKDNPDDKKYDGTLTINGTIDGGDANYLEAGHITFGQHNHTSSLYANIQSNLTHYDGYVAFSQGHYYVNQSIISPTSQYLDFGSLSYYEGEIFDAHHAFHADRMTFNIANVQFFPSVIAALADVAFNTTTFKFHKKARIDYQRGLSLNGDVTLDGVVSAPTSPEAIAEKQRIDAAQEVAKEDNDTPEDARASQEKPPIFKPQHILSLGKSGSETPDKENTIAINGEILGGDYMSVDANRLTLGANSSMTSTPFGDMNIGHLIYGGKWTFPYWSFTVDKTDISATSTMINFGSSTYQGETFNAYGPFSANDMIFNINKSVNLHPGTEFTLSNVSFNTKKFESHFGVKVWYEDEFIINSPDVILDGITSAPTSPEAHEEAEQQKKSYTEKPKEKSEASSSQQESTSEDKTESSPEEVKLFNPRHKLLVNRKISNEKAVDGDDKIQSEETDQGNVTIYGSIIGGDYIHWGGKNVKFGPNCDMTSTPFGEVDGDIVTFAGNITFPFWTLKAVEAIVAPVKTELAPSAPVHFGYGVFQGKKSLDVYGPVSVDGMRFVIPHIELHEGATPTLKCCILDGETVIDNSLMTVEEYIHVDASKDFYHGGHIHGVEKEAMFSVSTPKGELYGSSNIDRASFDIKNLPIKSFASGKMGGSYQITEHLHLVNKTLMLVLDVASNRSCTLSYDVHSASIPVGSPYRSDFGLNVNTSAGGMTILAPLTLGGDFTFNLAGDLIHNVPIRANNIYGQTIGEYLDAGGLMESPGDIEMLASNFQTLTPGANLKAMKKAEIRALVEARVRKLYNKGFRYYGIDKHRSKKNKIPMSRIEEAIEAVFQQVLHGENVPLHTSHGDDGHTSSVNHKEEVKEYNKMSGPDTEVNGIAFGNHDASTVGRQSTRLMIRAGAMGNIELFGDVKSDGRILLFVPNGIIKLKHTTEYWTDKNGQTRERYHGADVQGGMNGTPGSVDIDGKPIPQVQITCLRTEITGPSSVMATGGIRFDVLGDEEDAFSSKATCNTYVAYSKTKGGKSIIQKFVLFQKRHKEKEAADVGKPTIASEQGVVIINTPNGGVVSEATTFITADGVKVLSKLDTKMHGLNIKLRHSSSVKKLGGLISSILPEKWFTKNSKGKDEVFHPDVFVDDGHTLIKVTEGNINMLGTVFLGSGDLILHAVKGKIILTKKKLSHSVIETGFDIGISAPGLNAAKILGDGGSFWQALAAEDPLLGKIHELIKSKNYVEALVHLSNVGIQGFNDVNDLAQAISNGSLGNTLMQRYNLADVQKLNPTVTATFSYTRKKTNFQTLGPGDIQRGNVTLKAGTAVELLDGYCVHADSDITIETPELLMCAAALKYKQSEKTFSASISANAGGILGGGVAANRSLSSGVTHVNAKMTANGNIHFEVARVDLKGANISATTTSGSIDQLNISSVQDVHKSKSFGGSIDTNQNISLHMSCSKSKNITDESGIHIKQGYNNLKLSDVKLKGSSITTDGENVFVARSLTTRAVNDVERGVNLGIAFNLKDVHAVISHEQSNINEDNNKPFVRTEKNSSGKPQPKGKAIPTIRVTLGLRDYGAKHDATVYGKQGTELNVAKVNGFVNVKKPHGKHIHRDRDYSINLDVPIITKKNIGAAVDNIKNAYEKLIKKPMSAENLAQLTKDLDDFQRSIENAKDYMTKLQSDLERQELKLQHTDWLDRCPDELTNLSALEQRQYQMQIVNAQAELERYGAISESTLSNISHLFSKDNEVPSTVFIAEEQQLDIEQLEEKAAQEFKDNGVVSGKTQEALNTALADVIKHDFQQRQQTTDEIDYQVLQDFVSDKQVQSVSLLDTFVTLNKPLISAAELLFDVAISCFTVVPNNTEKPDFIANAEERMQSRQQFVYGMTTSIMKGCGGFAKESTLLFSDLLILGLKNPPVNSEKSSYYANAEHRMNDRFDALYGLTKSTAQFAFDLVITNWVELQHLHGIDDKNLFEFEKNAFSRMESREEMLQSMWTHLKALPAKEQGEFIGGIVSNFAIAFLLKKSPNLICKADLFNKIKNGAQYSAQSLRLAKRKPLVHLKRPGVTLYPHIVEGLPIYTTNKSVAASIGKIINDMKLGKLGKTLQNAFYQVRQLARQKGIGNLCFFNERHIKGFIQHIAEMKSFHLARYRMPLMKPHSIPSILEYNGFYPASERGILVKRSKQKVNTNQLPPVRPIGAQINIVAAKPRDMNIQLFNEVSEEHLRLFLKHHFPAEDIHQMNQKEIRLWLSKLESQTLEPLISNLIACTPESLFSNNVPKIRCNQYMCHGVQFSVSSKKLTSTMATYIKNKLSGNPLDQSTWEVLKNASKNSKFVVVIEEIESGEVSSAKLIFHGKQQQMIHIKLANESDLSVILDEELDHLVMVMAKNNHGLPYSTNEEQIVFESLVNKAKEKIESLRKANKLTEKHLEIIRDINGSLSKYPSEKYAAEIVPRLLRWLRTTDSNETNCLMDLYGDLIKKITSVYDEGFTDLMASRPVIDSKIKQIKQRTFKKKSPTSSRTMNTAHLSTIDAKKVFGQQKSPPLFQAYSGLTIASDRVPQLYTAHQIKNMPNLTNDKAHQFQFVIMPNGELRIADFYSKPIKLGSYDRLTIRQVGERTLCKIFGSEYTACPAPYPSKFNRDNRILYNNKGKPIYLQKPITHVDMADGNKVIAAGSFSVKNGKINIHDMNLIIDYYPCNGEHLPSVVEHVLNQAGFDEISAHAIKAEEQIILGTTQMAQYCVKKNTSSADGTVSRFSQRIWQHNAENTTVEKKLMPSRVTANDEPAADISKVSVLEHKGDVSNGHSDNRNDNQEKSNRETTVNGSLKHNGFFSTSKKSVVPVRNNEGNNQNTLSIPTSPSSPENYLNIDYYQETFVEPYDNSKTEILVFGGEYPIRPGIAIKDGNGYTITTYEFCRQYIGDELINKKYDRLKSKFSELETKFKETKKQGKNPETLLEQLSQQLNKAVYSLFSSDDNYVQLTVDLDNRWFSMEGRREIIEKVILTPKLATDSDKKQYNEILNNTAIPLKRGSYRISGYNDNPRSVYDSDGGKIPEYCSRYKFHKEYINAERAIVTIKPGDEISIRFSSASKEDKLSNQIVEHWFKLNAQPDQNDLGPKNKR